MGAGRDLVFTILGIDKGSDAFDKLSASADRAGKKLDSVGKLSAKALLGTTGAAAVAGAGIAATLSGTALLFGALGIAAVMSNEKVSASFTDLSEDIKRGTREAAEPLVPVMLKTAEQFGRTFDEIKPRLRGLFTDSIPAIESTVEGVTGLAREALPGLERAVKASAAPMSGVKDLLIDTGQGANLFFTNVSKGSESSGQIIRVFGTIIRETLGFTGNLLATLSNTGAPAVARLGQVFTQTLGVVQQLGAGAFPVLFGSAGAVLNVLSGLLSIVGSLSGVLGPLVGVATSVGLALKMMDTVTFGGVSTAFARVKDAMAGVSGARDKLAAGFGAMTAGMGALGVVAVGVGFALNSLGELQQRAAAAAAQHKSNVDALASALRDSNGAINDSVRASAAKALQDTQVGNTQKNMLQLSRELGLSLPRVTDAYLGNATAQREVNSTLDGLIAKGTYYVAESGTTVKALDEQGSSAAALKTQMGTSNSTMSEAVQKNRDLSQAQKDSAAATDVHSAALAKLHETLLGLVSKDLAYRQAVNGEREAHDTVAEAIDKHTEAKKRATEAVNRYGAGSQAAKDALAAEKDAQDGLTGALLGWEGNIQGAVASAGELALANYRGSDASEAQRLKMEASNKEIIRLASLAGNDAPASLRALIVGMDGAALSALGVTMRVDETGAAVYRLPNGKEIRITGDTMGAMAKIDELERRQIKDKFFNVFVFEKLVPGGGQVRGAYTPQMMAEGGPVQAWTPYLVGERGPELLITGQPGRVYDATSTRRMLSGSGGGDAGGSGLGEKHYHLTVINAANSLVDLRAQFERLELTDFPEG